MLVKKIDYSRFVRLVRTQNQSTAKRNVETLGNHLATFVSGGDIETSNGRPMRINLRIGTLVVTRGKIEFEALSVA